MNAMTKTPKVTEYTAAEVTPTYDAMELLQGSSTAQIVLDGNVYTLRLTRSSKLILTK